MPARGGLLTQPGPAVMVGGGLAPQSVTGRHFVPACGNPLGGSVAEATYSPQTPLARRRAFGGQTFV